MSRAALVLVAMIWGLSVPAAAQSGASGYRLPTASDSAVAETPPTDAEIAQRLITPLKQERCAPASGDAIVVCGHNAENDRQKMPIPHEPDSSGKTADGAPRAPNVSGLRDCSRGCIGFGSAPAPMYFFDITKLPEAPAGSDADRIARGEIRAP